MAKHGCWYTVYYPPEALVCPQSVTDGEFMSETAAFIVDANQGEDRVCGIRFQHLDDERGYPAATAFAVRLWVSEGDQMDERATVLADRYDAFLFGKFGIKPYSPFRSIAPDTVATVIVPITLGELLGMPGTPDEVHYSIPE